MEKLVMVDSCIFIEIILVQPLCTKCEDKLNDFKSYGHKICVSYEILYEIMTRIKEKIDEEIKQLNHTVIELANKTKLDLFRSHIASLKKLLENCKVLYEMDGYEIIRNKCNTLRVGEKSRGDRDKTNIATAIVNNCEVFITKDIKIYEEKETIKRISDGKLSIIYIN